MNDAIVYVFAPRERKGWRGGKERAIKIEMATFDPDGSYEPGRTIVDGFVPCDPETVDECLIFRAKLEVVT